MMNLFLHRPTYDGSHTSAEAKRAHIRSVFASVTAGTSDKNVSRDTLGVLLADPLLVHPCLSSTLPQPLIDRVRTTPKHVHLVFDHLASTRHARLTLEDFLASAEEHMQDDSTSPPTLLAAEHAALMQEVVDLMEEVEVLQQGHSALQTSLELKTTEANTRLVNLQDTAQATIDDLEMKLSSATSELKTVRAQVKAAQTAQVCGAMGRFDWLAALLCLRSSMTRSWPISTPRWQD